MKRSSFLILMLSVLLASCGKKQFVKAPIDDIIKDIPSTEVFSIILYDMDVEGTFFKKYKHQYKVIREKEPGKPTEKTTQWYEVSKEYFQKNAKNMGMTIASRNEKGKLRKTASPPGYGNYVGNSRYGSWTNRGGSSFWTFYGQYAFMNQMFNLVGRPARRSYFDDFTRNVGRNRPYYGPTTNGRSLYGTFSDFNSKNRSNSAWGRNTSSFKRRVAGRTSRSSSRYGGSSSRSRGGGFGK